MPTEPTKPTAPVQPPPIDWDKANNHLDDIESYLFKFNGVKGHNPHFILQETIAPLRESLNSPEERTKELFDKILSIKKEPPLSPTNKQLGKRLKFPSAKSPQEVSTDSGL